MSLIDLVVSLRKESFLRSAAVVVCHHVTFGHTKTQYDTSNIFLYGTTVVRYRTGIFKKNYDKTNDKCAVTGIYSRK